MLRPRFFTPDQYRFLKERSSLLLRAFDKVYHAAMADEAFRRQFRLFDWEEALIRHEPGFREQMAHPLLVDMSIHHFDLIRTVLGRRHCCDGRPLRRRLVGDHRLLGLARHPSLMGSRGDPAVGAAAPVGVERPGEARAAA